MHRQQQEQPIDGRVTIPRYATRYGISADDHGNGEVTEMLYGALDSALLLEEAAR